MQVFVFVSLKKIKLKQKCLDLRRDRLNWAQESSTGGHAPEHTFFFVFQKTLRGWSPPLPRCGEKQADRGWWVPVYVSVGERGPEEGINKAASNLSRRAAICLGLSPVGAEG